MNKTFKKIFYMAGCLTIALCMILPYSVKADDTKISTNTTDTIEVENNDTNNQTTTNNEENNNKTFDTAKELNPYLNGTLKSGTVTDVGEKIISKAYETADTIRSVGIPFVIILFIGSLVLFIWGAMSQRKTVMPGLCGMLACGLAYTFIVYAPQILQFFSNWLTN